MEIISPVNTDKIVFYRSVASLVILAVCIIDFSLLCELATNSNSIHRWIVSCLFIAQMLFIINHDNMKSMGFRVPAIIVGPTRWSSLPTVIAETNGVLVTRVRGQCQCCVSSHNNQVRLKSQIPEVTKL